MTEESPETGSEFDSEPPEADLLHAWMPLFMDEALGQLGYEKGEDY